MDLFAALRGTFVEKIRAEYPRLHELYGAGQSIEAAKVGRSASESVERDLAEQGIALQDLGKRIRSAVPPGGPGS